MSFVHSTRGSSPHVVALFLSSVVFLSREKDRPVFIFDYFAVVNF